MLTNSQNRICYPEFLIRNHDGGDLGRRRFFLSREISLLS